MKTLFYFFVFIFFGGHVRAQNPALLSDILQGVESSFPANLCTLNDFAFFTARNNESNYELWITDGTTAGTKLLLDINSDSLYGSMPEGFVRYNNAYYFTANDGVHGFELWKTDGTEEGTTLVADLLPGAYSSYPAELIVFNNTLFFRAYTEEFGAELWKTQGDAASTHLVADLAEGPLSFYPQYLFAGPNGIYFARSNNQGVYYSDGTSDGTFALSDDVIVGQLDEPYFEVFQNMIYFRGKDPVGPNSAGTQLWRIHGFDVERVSAIFNATSELNPTNLCANGDLLYFFGEEYPHGRELWAFDGQLAFMVRDIVPGEGGSVVTDFLIDFEDRVFFAAYVAESGVELWSSNGTAIGTQMVQDICPGATGSYPISPKVLENRLFFSADNGLGEQIWKIDHAALPATLFSNLTNAVANSSELESINGLYIFKGSSEACGTELWVLNEAAIVEHFKPQELNEVKLWPNPADEYIEVDFPKKAGKTYEFSMQDANGRLLFRCNFRDQQVFPLQSLDLSPGEYLIQIQNHEYSETRRIIIK
jgi:ELWxxDGT repeat protein